MADKTKMKTADQAPSLSKFLYKALVFVVVIIVVPLFPSRAPDFINQTLFTRGWELVHLLFVGIAVCYGLFSRRNDVEEIHKETPSSSSSNKVENAVSRFLQVSSVFDDELETLERPGGNDNDDESRVQSWSSQYSRGEPPVVVVSAADESSGDGGSRGMISRSIRTRVSDKPLLLPVRSLKSTSVFDSTRAVDHQADGDATNVVLRSPIPWRSRSGRMEMKEEIECSDQFKVSDENAFRPVRSGQQMPKSLSPSPSIDLSPRRSSGFTHSVSPEKDMEDGSRRKGIYKPSPPPAPPLPPPTYRKSSLMNSSPDGGGSRLKMASEKDLKRMGSDKDLRGSKTIEERDSSRSVREEMMRRMNARKLSSNIDNGPIVGKSVRTARSGDSVAGLKALPKDHIREIDDESHWKDVMEAPKERIGTKSPLIDHRSMCSEKPNIPEIIPPSRFSDQLKEVHEDIVTVESDCESESEDEDQVSETLNSCRREEEAQPVNQTMQDFGPDVDKKADEFIAKFREQIRLQRIESIKRSTYQATRKVT
ncbi:unnamed protein product [Rhodiola kirilowii]